jgi:hypothetical protein
MLLHPRRGFASQKAIFSCDRQANKEHTKISVKTAFMKSYFNNAALKNFPCLEGVKFQSVINVGGQLGSKHQGVYEIPFLSK